MKCEFEIDYLKKNISIERQNFNRILDLKKSTVVIDRVVASWLLEKKVSTVFIDKEKYKIISIYIPQYSEWVILQNGYLPISGAYFLN